MASRLSRVGWYAKGRYTTYRYGTHRREPPYGNRVTTIRR